MNLKAPSVQLKEMTETAILKYTEKRIDPKETLHHLKPFYGVHLKDKAPEGKGKGKTTAAPSIDVDGGTYYENPILQGRKMSKITYNESKRVGLQMGYLEKVESSMKK
jgi:hypothetical protein